MTEDKRDQKELDQDYSARDWEIELPRLVNGDREAALIRLGGVEEYVEVKLANSRDAIAARAAFHEALRNFVLSWQPSPYEREYRSKCMLELIAIYRPNEGFVRAVEFLQHLRRIGEIGDLREDESSELDLHLNALVSLESYFPVAPLTSDDDNLAFKSYVRLLREDLRHPQYGSYAVRRLVELGVIDLEEKGTLSIIDRNTAALHGIVSFLLDPDHRYLAETELSKIFVYCLGNQDKIEFFRKSIQQNGAELQCRDEGPVIMTDRDPIVLDLTPDALKVYMLQVVYGTESERGRAKLEKITASY